MQAPLKDSDERYASFYPRPFASTQDEPLGYNFCYPYLADTLKTEGVQLKPFNPHIHTSIVFEHMKTYPQDYKYMGFTTPRTLNQLHSFIDAFYCRNPANMIFVVIETSRVHSSGGYGGISGIVSLTNCDPKRASAQISKGVAFDTNRSKTGAAIASALLLRYCFNLPTDAPPGLALRRVTWVTHGNNIRAQALASRLGMRLEATMRWYVATEEGQEDNGRDIRRGDPIRKKGLDALKFVMCWDEWEGGAGDCARGVIAVQDTDAVSTKL